MDATITNQAFSRVEIEALYEQELRAYLAVRTKRQTAHCGCSRVLDRQSGFDSWLVVESRPCTDHKDDPRIAFMWV